MWHWSQFLHPDHIVRWNQDFHCWISCSKLRFWTTILKFILSMTGACLHSSHEHFFQNSMQTTSPCLTYTPQFHFYCQSTAKTLIALNWKSPKPSTVKAWQAKLWEFYIIAKPNYSLLPHSSLAHSNKLLNIWTFVLDYLSHQ